jgi:hypothetical protein
LPSTKKIVVLQQQQKNFEKWKAKVRCGSRWTAAETVFSLEKDVCRVYVCAKKFPNIVKEMILKASLYIMFVVEKIDCESDVT